MLNSVDNKRASLALCFSKVELLSFFVPSLIAWPYLFKIPEIDKSIHYRMHTKLYKAKKKST